MLVGSGASGKYLDDRLTPDLNGLMIDYTELESPRKKAIVGEQELLGTVMGIVPKILTDRKGKKHPVRTSGVFVSQLGLYLFSPKEEVKKSIVTVTDKDGP